MSPAEKAVALVLRAWHEWPGSVDPREPTGREMVLRELGGHLQAEGLVENRPGSDARWYTVPSASGQDLLDRLDAPEATSLLAISEAERIAAVGRAERAEADLVQALAAEPQMRAERDLARGARAIVITPPSASPVPAAERWAWGLTDEAGRGIEDSREAAIAAARERALADGKDGATVYICGEIEEADPAAYVPTAASMLAFMSEGSYPDQPDEVRGESWPDPTAEARDELRELLEPIRAWARRHCSTWRTDTGPIEAVPPEAT